LGLPECSHISEAFYTAFVVSATYVPRFPESDKNSFGVSTARNESAESVTDATKRIEELTSAIRTYLETTFPKAAISMTFTINEHSRIIIRAASSKNIELSESQEKGLVWALRRTKVDISFAFSPKRSANDSYVLFIPTNLALGEHVSKDSVIRAVNKAAQTRGIRG